MGEKRNEEAWECAMGTYLDKNNKKSEAKNKKK